MANGIVRLDRVRAVYNGHIESVVKKDGELQNGYVVDAGTLVTGERELREAKVPTAGKGGVVLVAHPEVTPDQRTHADMALENFKIPAGKPARAYHLEAGDIFSVSQDVLTLLSTDAVVGNYVVTDNSFKLKEANSPSTEEFVGKIIGIDTIGTQAIFGSGVTTRVNKLVVIEVVKN